MGARRISTPAGVAASDRQVLHTLVAADLGAIGTTVTDPAPFGMRLARRLRAELLNVRRGLALIGWRRADGPPLRAGAVVRPFASESTASQDDASGDGRQRGQGDVSR
jgi:hypothetical protein